MAVDAVLLGEEEVGAIGARLVPALDGGADGARRDGQEQAPRHAPAVLDLVAQGLPLGLVQRLGTADAPGVGRVPRDEGALAQQRQVLHQSLLVGEGLDVAHQLLAGDSLQRVPDSKTHKRG